MKPEWFSVDGIDNKTFSISEYGHWEQPHSYLFLGKTKALLIDSGLGVGNIKTVVTALTSLPVRVVLTHGHWDHTGGLKWFKDFGIHKNEAAWIEKGLPVSEESIKKTFMHFPPTQEFPDGFDLSSYKSFVGKPAFFLNEGYKIDLGGRTIEVIHTPGHSPGSVCFYERSTGYLATGDTLYEGILDAFYPSTDPLAFAESIDRLNGLPRVSKILPGHFRLNIGSNYLREAQIAFADLKARGVLRHGTGIHSFPRLKIHL